MPTTAVTGTRGAKKAAAKTDKPETPDLAGPEGYVQPDVEGPHDPQDGSGDAPEAPKVAAQPLADPNGNGTVQATNPDGSTTNIDGCEKDWADKVREINPKHTAIKHL
jgi:hypothetical protein